MSGRNRARCSEDQRRGLETKQEKVYSFTWRETRGSEEKRVCLLEISGSQRSDSLLARQFKTIPQGNLTKLLSAIGKPIKSFS